ncbi:hypothetical protein [Pseudomonas rubra]|uniref:Uncharacterized protein n=1 Tax=Pseudomonas rubra TaxID=2942627 RepID=A0ABT5PGG1_9PSED|nr:hypothetical protein [Pseudomonas rubra]MDD1017363.1 hypothetical protein [Pseudomonas rubra]MDD1041814.1 hypothetical protein [Pseudomonas rubra]MDD1158087.1 hypothetical protein [Pseudomonas rubra]
MPTENRSSNTEQMVSVPRDEVERLVKLLQYQAHPYPSPHAEFWQGLLDAPVAQYQGEPALSIPDGYCIMPRQLNAENGAKALLLGEFKLEVTRECPECLDLEEPAEGCEICDGEGEYGQSHTIPWDQIKFIYSEAVKGLALQPNAAR